MRSASVILGRPAKGAGGPDVGQGSRRQSFPAVPKVDGRSAVAVAAARGACGFGVGGLVATRRRRSQPKSAGRNTPIREPAGIATTASGITGRWNATRPALVTLRACSAQRIGYRQPAVQMVASAPETVTVP